MRIDRITLIETRTDRVTVRLEARIDERGDLLLEGQDLGELVEERFGDGDYEYELRVSADDKDTILLHLLGERFADDAQFKEWLAEKGIPSDFRSF